jgi:CO dehydrogenase maturation factor
VLRELRSDGLLVIVDMEASPEHLARSTAEAVDLMLVVAEPYFRSLETARRTVALAAGLGIPKVRVVANKLRDAGDRDAVELFCARHGMQLIGTVPFDEALGDAERAGGALADHDGGAPSLRAIDRLVDRVLEVPTG